MRPALPRLIASLSAALLVAGAAAPSLGAEAEIEDKTACIAEIEPNIAEIEPNDDATAAVTFEGERCISSTLVEVGDADVFLWQVDEADAAVSWSLQIDGIPQSATTLTVHGVAPDAGGDVVRLQTGPELKPAVAEVSVETGTYALVVSRDDPAPGVELTDDRGYELRLAKAAAPEATPATTIENETARVVVVAAGEAAPMIGGDVAVELLLDTSGSMLERLGSSTKLKVAERTLVALVDDLPSGTPVALRTFKAKPSSCATVLRVPLEPLRPKAMKQTIRDLPARRGTRTPIAKALEQVPQDLRGFEGHRLVVLVTDGKEDCGGDPAAAVKALAEAGYTSTVHLIGDVLPDGEELRQDLADWAALGGGRFFEAPDRASLAAALRQATSAPYLVFDEEDVLVAQGLVGDAGVEVDAGVYRVEVLSDPPSTYEAVDLHVGAVVELREEGAA